MNDRKKNNRNIFEIIKNSFSRLIQTGKLIRKKNEYKQLFYFLISYIFYGASGVVFSTLMPTSFLNYYQLEDGKLTQLNLMYKVALLIGILLGLLSDRVIRVK